VGPEFPAAEAPADAIALRRLAAFNVTVRAQPTLDSAQATDAESADEAMPTPSDAGGFDVRASRYIVQHDYVRAIADLDQAIKLDPTSAKYFYNRGAAHFDNHEDALALADFNRALELNPKDSFALQARAELHLFQHDDAAAQRDFDAAVQASPGNPGVLAREARAYEAAGRHVAAIAIYGVLIAKAPSAALYNARCWIRAEANVELQAALADCDASLKLEPSWSATLDSRGFVNLRLGRLDDAIGDYTASLRAGASNAWSLYGRGVAEMRKGDVEAGSADVAAAKALYPKIAAEFTLLGIAARATSPAPAK
jgi:tetratricopeptide (TPR) repeat protein